MTDQELTPAKVEPDPADEDKPKNLPQAAVMPAQTVDHPLTRWIMEAATMAEALEVAKEIAKMDLVPAELAKKPQNIVGAIMKGAEVGLPTMAALSFIIPINGRPFIYGEGYLALILSKGGYFDTVELFDEESGHETIGFSVKAFRVGRPSQEGRFTLDDAKRAGLLDAQGRGRGTDGGSASPWTKYPRDMLWWRAIHRAGTRQFADWTAGLAPTQIAGDYEGDFLDGEVIKVARKVIGQYSDIKGADDEEATEAASAAGEVAASPPVSRSDEVLSNLTDDSGPEAQAEPAEASEATDDDTAPETVTTGQAVNDLLDRYKVAGTGSDVEALDVELLETYKREDLAKNMRASLTRAATSARLRLKLPPRSL